MNQDEIISVLKMIIEPFVVKKGFDLVEINLGGPLRRRVLSIFTDRPEGGVTMEECAMLNREIQLLLEREAVLEESYVLEVSSPGLDRPFVNKKDFERALRRNLRVFLKDFMSAGIEENKRKEFAGTLVDVADDTISLNTKDGVLIIPISNITMAKQIY